MKRCTAILFLLLSAWSPSAAPSPPAESQTGISFSLPRKWTETPIATITPTGTQPPTGFAALTGTPPLTPTGKPMADGTGVHPSSEEELESVDSIWSWITYRELTAPGTAAYAASIPADSVSQWLWWFCAARGNFHSFMDSTGIRFLLGGESLIEGDHLQVLDGTSPTGWLCRRWATALARWPPNRGVNFEIRWTRGTEVDDGLTDGPAGEYRQTITVIAD